MVEFRFIPHLQMARAVHLGGLRYWVNLKPVRPKPVRHGGWPNEVATL